MLDFRIPGPEERFSGNVSIRAKLVGVESYRRTLWNPEWAWGCVHRTLGYNRSLNARVRGKVLGKCVNWSETSGN